MPMPNEDQRLGRCSRGGPHRPQLLRC